MASVSSTLAIFFYPKFAVVHNYWQLNSLSHLVVGHSSDHRPVSIKMKQGITAGSSERHQVVTLASPSNEFGK